MGEPRGPAPDRDREPPALQRPKLKTADDLRREVRERVAAIQRPAEPTPILVSGDGMQIKSPDANVTIIIT